MQRWSGSNVKHSIALIEDNTLILVHMVRSIMHVFWIIPIPAYYQISLGHVSFFYLRPVSKYWKFVRDTVVFHVWKCNNMCTICIAISLYFCTIGYALIDTHLNQSIHNCHHTHTRTHTDRKKKKKRSKKKKNIIHLSPIFLSQFCVVGCLPSRTKHLCVVSIEWETIYWSSNFWHRLAGNREITKLENSRSATIELRQAD